MGILGLNTIRLQPGGMGGIRSILTVLELLSSISQSSICRRLLLTTKWLQLLLMAIPRSEAIIQRKILRLIRCLLPGEPESPGLQAANYPSIHWLQRIAPRAPLWVPKRSCGSYSTLPPHPWKTFHRVISTWEWRNSQQVPILHCLPKCWQSCALWCVVPLGHAF